jgi:superkiller protein 3
MEDEHEGRRLVARADQLSSEGRYEEAIATYEHAIARAPRAFDGYRFVIGELLFELQRYDEAARAFDAIVRSTPGHAQAWEALGRTWSLSGHPDAALRAFEHAIALAPGWAEPLYQAAVAYAELGDRPRSADHLRRALALDPRLAQRAAEDAL